MSEADTNKLTDATQTQCVSMIMPMDQHDKKKNYEVLKKPIQQAKSLLQGKALPENVAHYISLKLERIFADLEKASSPAIGVYLSLKLSQSYRLLMDREIAVTIKFY